MKILFIGNSFTFFFGIPKMVEELARQNGIDVSQDSVIKGGRRMIENLTAGDEHHNRIKKLLETNHYDAVILQEQSHTPITDNSAFTFGFNEVSKWVNADRVILYSTWGYKDGHAWLSENNMTSDEMEAKLTDAYRNLANTLSAEITEVGPLFTLFKKQNPDIDIYDKDMIHPNYIGSSLSALAHYKRLFGSIPKDTSFINLDSDTKEKMLKAVDEVIKA